jgi:hypothetical protein
VRAYVRYETDVPFRKEQVIPFSCDVTASAHEPRAYLKNGKFNALSSISIIREKNLAEGPKRIERMNGISCVHRHRRRINDRARPRPPPTRINIIVKRTKIGLSLFYFRLHNRRRRFGSKTAGLNYIFQTAAVDGRYNDKRTLAVHTHKPFAALGLLLRFSLKNYKYYMRAPAFA